MAPIVFFCRCRPQDADPIEIVLGERRIFIGWPAWRPGRAYRRGHLRDAIVDLSCSEQEWQSVFPRLGKDRRHYTQNRNLVAKVTPGSIVLVPRASRGVVFAGRISGSFQLINNPPWSTEYLQLRRSQGLTVDEESSHVADVAQTWQVDRFRPLPLPLVPAWIRASLFGRSTYGEIRGIDALALQPFEILEGIIERPERVVRPWTADRDEVERRLVADVGPSTFEHLCVALLQLEHPKEIWAHIGGAGDGGVDGIGADKRGSVVSLLQCKWRYDGEELSFATPWGRGSGAQRRVVAALIHADDVPIESGLVFWSRRRIAELMIKHAAQLPLAVSMRIDPRSKK